MPLPVIPSVEQVGKPIIAEARNLMDHGEAKHPAEPVATFRRNRDRLRVEPRAYRRPGREKFSRAVEKPCHKRIDPLRHAGVRQRRADKAARALKFHILRQGNGRCDCLRHARSLGDRVVEGIACLEARNRQAEYDFVEISRAPLTPGLKGLTALTCRFAVQKSGEITCFLFNGRRGPIELVFNDRRFF